MQPVRREIKEEFAMAKASIKLPDGTSVVIEGSPEEVAKLLSIYGARVPLP